MKRQMYKHTRHGRHSTLYLYPATPTYARYADKEIKQAGNDTAARLTAIQKAVFADPYKAKYHKQYAQLLYGQYLKIKDNARIPKAEKQSLDNQILTHYRTYKTIAKLNAAFDRYKIARNNRVYINTLKAYLGQADGSAGVFAVHDTLDIDGGDAHRIAANREYSSDPQRLFVPAQGKQTQSTRQHSYHGTGTGPRKYSSSTWAAVLIPFFMMLFSQLVFPHKATASEPVPVEQVIAATGPGRQETELQPAETVEDYTTTAEHIRTGATPATATAAPKPKAYATVIPVSNSPPASPRSSAYIFAVFFLVWLIAAAYYSFAGTGKGTIEDFVKKTFAKGAFTLGILLGTLGPAKGQTTAVDFAVQRTSDEDWVDSVKYTLTMVDDTTIKYEGIADVTYMHFSNVKLNPHYVDNQLLERAKPLTELIGAGQDYLINFTSKEKPREPVRVYDITGKIVTEIPVTWDPSTKIASAYWNGRGSHGEKVDEGVYIMTGNGIAVKVMEMNTGIFIGASVIASERSERGNLLKQTVIASRRRGNLTQSGRYSRTFGAQYDGTTKREKSGASADYIVHVEPASHDPHEQFMPMDTILTFVEDSTQNQFPLYVDSVPQILYLNFHLARTFNTDEPLAGATYNIKEKNHGTIIGTGVTDSNGNVTIKIPIGITATPQEQYIYDKDTVYVEFGGLEEFWSKKNCPLLVPNKIVFLNDTISDDTIYNTLTNKNTPVPRKPLDTISPPTIVFKQIRPVTKAPWEPESSIDDSLQEIKARAPPIGYVLIEEAMKRPVYYYNAYAGTNQEGEFRTLMNKLDSLFYGTDTMNWIEVNTPFNKDTIDSLMQYYDYRNNYYPGQIGINIVDNGTDETNSNGVFTTDPRGWRASALCYGYASVTLGEYAFYKEIQGRIRRLRDVNYEGAGGEDSFMNPNPAHPTFRDRSFVKVLRKESENIYYYRTATWGVWYYAPSDLSIEYTGTK